MRTWEENAAAINQFWPTQWTQEEKKLLHDDLSSLDQPMLYDAIRNTKRCHDTPFVHLKWILDEYRSLDLARKHAMKSAKVKIAAEPKLRLVIDEDADKGLVKDFLNCIDSAEPSQFLEIETLVLDKLPKMNADSAVRVISYARARLLGQETQFSRVTKGGDLQAISYAKQGWK